MGFFFAGVLAGYSPRAHPFCLCQCD